MRSNLFPTHGRIKDKAVSTFNRKNPIKKKTTTTTEEREYLSWLQTIEANCMVCNKNADHWHHVKLNSTDKKNHFELIPLCIDHHVGNELSPHGTPKKWRQKFSMEGQLAKAYYYYELYKST